MRLERFDETLYKELQNPEFAQAYLAEALDDSFEEFLVALRKYVQANGGFSRCAEMTELSREALYRMLSETGNPEFRSIQVILNAYNLKLSIQHHQQSDLSRELALST